MRVYPRRTTCFLLATSPARFRMICFVTNDVQHLDIYLVAVTTNLAVSILARINHIVCTIGLGQVVCDFSHILWSSARNCTWTCFVPQFY